MRSLSGGTALVATFLHLFDDLGHKGIKVIGAAGGYDPLVGNHLFILPVGAGVFRSVLIDQ